VLVPEEGQTRKEEGGFRRPIGGENKRGRDLGEVGENWERRVTSPKRKNQVRQCGVRAKKLSWGGLREFYGKGNQGRESSAARGLIGKKKGEWGGKESLARPKDGYDGGGTEGRRKGNVRDVFWDMWRRREASRQTPGKRFQCPGRTPNCKQVLAQVNEKNRKCLRNRKKKRKKGTTAGVFWEEGKQGEYGNVRGESQQRALIRKGGKTKQAVC